MAAVSKGFGRHNYYVTPDKSVEILRNLFCVEILGIWASSLARISVACMLLQFEISVSWKATLWIAIFLQLGVAFSSNICQFMQCRPLVAMWNIVPGAGCWAPRRTWIYSCVLVGMNCEKSPEYKIVTKCRPGAIVISDLTFALMPMFLIWKLGRKLLERILVSVLMALGLCAFSAVIVRAHYMKDFNVTVEDTFREMMNLFMWCRIEECVLIASACAPFLKAPIERILCRLGMSTFGNITRELNSVHSSGDISQMRCWHRYWKREQLRINKPTESQGIIT